MSKQGSSGSDGVSRRGALECMIWAGTGVLWTLSVRIVNFTFQPQTVTVPVGTTVTWVNEDDIPHLVAK